MKIYKPSIFVVLLLALFVSTAFINQGPIEEKKSIFDLLNFQEVVEVELFTNFEKMDSLRKTNEYQGATFAFEGPDEKVSKWAIKVRTRGKYRRRICDQPPIKLNFVKPELEKAGLRKDDELKLVTQCKNGSTGKDYVLREYLAYQLYQIISDNSYRSQLVRIKYNCTATGDVDKGWGIILEDEKTLARRLNAKSCDECYGRKKEQFESSELTKASLYQYMIGNTDFSVTLSKNIKIFTKKNDPDSTLTVAPYDFDFSGLVNASYSLPRAEHGQKTVRDRVFLGLSSDEELAPTIEHFKAKKEELFDRIDSFKLLSKSSRNDIKSYLKDFYSSIEETGIKRSIRE